MRGDQLKEGKRSDSVFMGILHEEWLALNGSSNGSNNGFQRMSGSTDPSGSTDRAADNG
jgi:hypothetical protein